MLKIKTINFILTFFFVLYFFIFFLRLFLDKQYIHSIYFSIMICMFFFLRKILLGIVFFKTVILKKPPGKISELVQQFSHFVQNSFFIDFLANKLWLNRIFIKITLSFIKITEYGNSIILFFFLNLWLIYFSVFFFEIFQGNTIHLTFFVLALIIFLQMLLRLFLFITVSMLDQLLNYSFKKYLPTFSPWQQTFFLKNDLLRNELFYFHKIKQKEEYLIYVWDLVQELNFYHNKFSQLTVLKDHILSSFFKLISWLNFIFNITLLAISFFLFDFKLKIVLIFLLFLFFYLLLSFFASIKEDYDVYQGTIQSSINWNIEIMTEIEKKKFSKKKFEEFHFDFLISEKLINLNKLNKTILQLHIKKNSKNQNLDEILKLEALENDLLLNLGTSKLSEENLKEFYTIILFFQQWMEDQIQKGCLNQETFIYTPKKDS